MHLDEWLARLASLRVYRQRHGIAPHKPLLLLVVLDLAEESDRFGEILDLTPELAFRFCTFWSIVAHRRTQRPDVRFPFFHLNSDGFWTPVDEHGQVTTERTRTRRAALDPEFVRFVKNPEYREKARRLLIETYFEPEERVQLYALVGMRPPTKDEIATAVEFKARNKRIRKGREARFRLDVMAAYDYTCALTGYRLTSISGICIVDAAHIHQFADSRNNDIRNGLALSKNAHWLFDHGLWSLTDDYKVIVAEGHFLERGPQQMLLKRYHGRRINLPANPQLWPNPVHLSWHRKNKLQSP